MNTIGNRAVSLLKSAKDVLTGAGRTDHRTAIPVYPERTKSERRLIRERVAQAAVAIPRSWPIRRFIYRNPLQGFEHLPFEQALRRGKSILGGKGLLSNRTYRTLYREGRISEEGITEALQRCLTAAPYGEGNPVGDEPARALERLRAQWLSGEEEADSALPENDRPDWTVSEGRTVGEWIARLGGPPVVETINEQMVRWCPAFLDEGLAAWSMPSRELGFYAAWRDLCRFDPSGRFLNIPSLSRKVRGLPESPEDLIAGCLGRLEVPDSEAAGYLTRHLGQLPGWAGFIKWRSGDGDYGPQICYPIDLVQYLAVRLFYEAELADSACRRAFGIPGTLTALRARFSEGQALRTGPSAENKRDFSPEPTRPVLDDLKSLPADHRALIWLEALERTFRSRLLRKLARAPGPSSPPPDTAPRVQAVFCIDARSEGLRRRLETLGGYETFGFAGFFGVPICYRPFESEEIQYLCPALISPRRMIPEIPRPGEEPNRDRYRAGGRLRHFGEALFHDLKTNNFTAFVLIDFLGGLFGLGFIGRTFFPRATLRLNRWLRERYQAPVSTRLRIDPPAPTEGDPAVMGFTLEEQAAMVESGLRLMGLTQRFARIVLFCAHGSRSENNPYAAAYDCGACGGHHGGPNARALAAMANRPEIRAALRERGLSIPEDTWFIAGEHNTATDRFDYLDIEDLPSTHREDADRLSRDFRTAGLALCAERMARLPGSRASTIKKASLEAEIRSLDWAQVRPEWGLSSCAAFIIGPRRLTEGIDLEGRVFLHSYDAGSDPDGTRLETIMTAPLLVVQWIVMEYYFSSTDPWTYGGGNKVLHNVVGGFGVMLGRAGDLRPGLPLQSVIHGDTLYHEPMRPLVLIDAPRERVVDIIRRHEVLSRIFDQRWVNLLALDRRDGLYREYRPGGVWETVRPPAGKES